MKDINNIKFFDSDDDFYVFCVTPQLDVHSHTNIYGDTTYYTDFEFTNGYNDDIDNGIMFMIKNPNSSIQKRGCVSYRGHAKRIKNLIPYRKSYERVINEHKQVM